MAGLGTHLIVELFDCNEFAINDSQRVEEILLTAAELSGATIVKPFFHTFSPYGVSGVIVIAESHFTIHTWPEHGYAAVDIFTCGDLDNDAALEYIEREFGAGRCEVVTLDRGVMDRTRAVRDGDLPLVAGNSYAIGG